MRQGALERVAAVVGQCEAFERFAQLEA